jgi:hypothetical protein
MDVSAITAVSNLLNIKEKLFPQNREEAKEQKIDDDLSIYCFLYLEHAYSELAEKETLELMITRRSNFTIPIRHLDWLFEENQLETIKPKSCEIPQLLQINSEGLVITIEPDTVLEKQIQYRQLKGRTLKNALDSLYLQCTYANGYKSTLPAPQLLKDRIYESNS